MIEPTDELISAWTESSCGCTVQEVIASIARKAAAWGYQQCAMEQLREASRELQAFGIAPSSSNREDGPMFKGSWDGAGNAP